MNIKKQDENHIIITRTLTDRLIWLSILFSLIVSLIWLTDEFSINWMTDGFSIFLLCIVGLLGLLIVGRMTIDGRKLTIDKMSENLVAENRILIFFRKKRVIPLNAISSVIIDHKKKGFCINWSGFKNIDIWKVYIAVGSKIILVADRNGEIFDWNMFFIALEIAEHAGKELMDMNGKFYYYPNNVNVNIAKPPNFL